MHHAPITVLWAAHHGLSFSAISGEMVSRLTTGRATCMRTCDIHTDKFPMPVASPQWESSLFRKEPLQEKTPRRCSWNEVHHPMVRLGVAGLGSCNDFRMMRISSGRCMARGLAPTPVTVV
jgi:hypothetical protein